MQKEKSIQVNEVEYCKLHAVYEADSESVKAKIEEAVNTLRKGNVPGFRPGKAPNYAIKKSCKKQIDAWVARELTVEAYDHILHETKVKAIGQPQVTKVELTDEEHFSCEMTVMKKPLFDLKEYKGFEIPKPHFNRDEMAQVEAAIQDLRMRFGEIEPYGDNDFVELKDQVTLDFSALLEGVAVDGQSAEGVLYTVGEGQFPGFDDNLLGMSAGEKREFNLNIPEGVPVIGGKEVQFQVQVHMGTKRKPCNLDDEFAKKVGMNTVEEVQTKLKELVLSRIQNNELQLIRQQISKRLVTNHDFEIPEWLKNMEAEYLATQNGLDWKKLSDEDKKTFGNQSVDNVKLSLILDSIRDAEPETVLSDAEAIGSLKQRVASQGADPEQFVVESQKNGRLFGLVAALRDEFVLQWVVNSCKIID